MPVDRLQASRVDVPDISADLIAGRRFGQTWRGYDPEEVKEFLGQVAEQVRTLRERLDMEVTARRDADQRAMHPRIDEATLMSAVGEETAAILRSARTAAAEIISKAEGNAQSLVAAAEAKSGDLVAHSEALSTRRAEEAEVAANELWARALADAEELRQSAHQDAQAIREEATQKGQESIEAAEVLRERILTDLARRRKLATVQIEQLRAGRERLLDAYLVVRRTLDEVTDELQRADAEARAAAVTVGRLERDEQTGELVDLRHDENLDSLAAFGGPEPNGHGGDQKTTAETPVVLAPKVTKIAAAPAASGADAPTAPAPAGATPATSAPRRSAAGASAAGASAAAASAPTIAAPTVVASAVAPAPPRRAVGVEDSPVQDETVIVSRQDAVESVRIVRSDPSNEESAGGPELSGPDLGGVTARPFPGAAAPDAPDGPSTGEDRATGTEDGETATGDTGEQSAAGDGDGDGDGESAVGEASASKDVQGLFARLRENRDQATRAARKTLGDTDSQDATEPGPGPATTSGQEHGGQEAGGGPEAGSPGTSAPGRGAPAANGAKGAHRSGATEAGTEAAAGTEAGVVAVAATTSQEAALTDAAETEAQPDPGEMLRQRADEVTRDVGSSLARKLKRELQDEQNSLLDRLRSLKGTPTPAKVLPDADEHPDHFADAGRPLLLQAAQAGARVANELGGDEVASVAIDAQQVDDLAEELGRAIAEPLRQRLELAMRSAGDDPSELADALGAAYREWKTQRIEASAHHEVAAAFARGAYLAFPEGSLLRWVVGPSEGPCPDCEDNALAGDQPKGEAWPTGQLYPPAHPGCRCTLVPADPDGAGPSAASS